MYTKPLESSVYNMLAIAQYIIAHPSILTGQINLFEGHSQYEHFNKTFNEVVRTHKYKIECIGISVEYFGTNYIIKGAVTFVFKGCTVYLRMDPICLHENWTLEGVIDRYIKYDKIRDHFFGRSVSGLPILKNSLQCPLITLIYRHVKIISRSKENSSI